MLTIEMCSYLCCPICKSSGLRTEIDKKAGDLVEDGTLVCDTCQRSYSVQAGVPNLKRRVC